MGYVRLLNLLACAQIAFFLTTALWLPPFRYPQVPLVSFLRDWPMAVQVVAFVGSLAGTFFAKRPQSRPTRRIRHAVCAVGFGILFAFDQHQLQPWAYQLCILHGWLALANPRWMLTGWRWLTISIYVYSALSKFDYSFCVNHGPFLLDGFLHVFGDDTGTRDWPSHLRFAAAAAMPMMELLTAGLLCFQRSQRIGLWLTISMHLFLIAALGPWGHNHSTGVLIWNLFFIIQNALLFPSPIPLDDPLRAFLQRRSDQEKPLSEVPITGNEDSPRSHRLAIAGWVLLAIPLLAPLGEPFGLWDHWPSWAVYAARPERVTVFVHEDEVARIPAELQQYLLPPEPLDVWQPFHIDRWSLEATHTPIYPEARFQVGVALALADQCELSTMKLTIDSPPNRWTGRRTRREYIGLEAIHELARTFWLNAMPG